MRERARVVDVRRRELQLLGQVRREPDDLREQALDVARQRLDLGRVVVHVRQRLELADEVRLVGDALGEPDALQAADEDAQRPVGDLDHLVDDRDRADLVDVVPAGRLDRRRRARSTSASRRSPATTSSISRIERSCPIASGIIDCGKTTVSLSGSTGSVAGSSMLRSRCRPGISKATSVIGAPPRS